MPPADYWVSWTSKAFSALAFQNPSCSGSRSRHGSLPLDRTLWSGEIKGGSASEPEIDMGQSQPPHMNGALSRADLQSVAPTTGS